VANAFQGEFISRYGYPRYLITDRGKENLNKMMKTILDQGLVEHRPTTAYHPQANAVAERLHRTIKEWIKKLGATKEWRARLPMILHQYRNTPHKATKVTPFYALFGRNAVTPVLLNWPVMPEPTLKNKSKMHEAMAKNIKLQGHQNKAQQSQVKENHRIIAGDHVMIMTKAASKWIPQQKGPFLVTTRFKNDMVQIQSIPKGPPLGGMHPIVHVSRLLKMPAKLRDPDDEDEDEEEVIQSGSEEHQPQVDDNEVEIPAEEPKSRYGRALRQPREWWK